MGTVPHWLVPHWCVPHWSVPHRSILTSGGLNCGGLNSGGLTSGGRVTRSTENTLEMCRHAGRSPPLVKMGQKPGRADFCA